MRERMTLNMKEIKRLVEWLESIDPPPDCVDLITHATGIGLSIRAEFETSDGEGRFKDLTDYERW